MSEEMNVQSTSGMVVTESMKADLLTSAKWAKFLCIVGCVGVGLMVVLSLVMFFMGSRMFSQFSVFAGMGSFFALYYLLFAAILIYPLVKGFQFANGVKAACLTNNNVELARGFAGMKGYLQFIGILTIVCLAIYAVLVIGSLIAFCAVASHC